MGVVRAVKQLDIPVSPGGVEQLQAAICKTDGQQAPVAVQGQQGILRVGKAVVHRHRLLPAVKVDHSPLTAIGGIHDGPALLFIYGGHGGAVGGAGNGGGRLAGPERPVLRQAVTGQRPRPGVDQGVLVQKQGVGQGGVLRRQLRQLRPGLRVVYAHLALDHRRRPGPLRGQGRFQGLAGQGDGPAGPVSVGQVINSQGLGQGPLGLGGVIRVQQPPLLWQGLQGVLDGSRHVPLLQCVGGVSRQGHGVLGPFHLLESHKGHAAPGQKAQGQQSRCGRHAPLPAAGAGVVLMQALKGTEHLRRRLPPLVRVGLHGLLHNGRYCGADLFGGDGLYLLGILGGPPPGEQVIQGSPGAVDVRAHIQQHRPPPGGRAACAGGHHSGRVLLQAGGGLVPHPLGGPQAGVVNAIVLRRGIAPAEAHPHCALLPQGQGDVKVDEPDIPLGCEHQVRRLDVTVEDAVGRTAVEIAQGLQQLTGPLDHLGLGKALPPF